MPHWADWVIFGVCTTIGVGVSIALRNKRKHLLALFGGVGGYFGGDLITMAVGIENTYLYYTICVATAIVAFVLTLFFNQKAIILLTALSGSYLFVRGISLYAGGFPNEFTIHEDIQSGAVKLSDYGKMFYIYISCILLLFLISLFVQIKTNRKSNQSST